MMVRQCFLIESKANASLDQENSIENVDTLNQFNTVLSRLFSVFIIYFFIFLFYMNDELSNFTGAISALIEALLPIPQLINNHRAKSVESLR